MSILNFNLNDRLPEKYKETSLMLGGDLWLKGKGLAIQKPTNDAAKMLEIQEGFATQNVLEEVSDRRRDGILGREPRWNLVNEKGEATEAAIKEMVDALVQWWNERNMLAKCKDMLEAAHCERRSLVRPFASSTAYEVSDKTKTLKSLTSFAAALDSLYFEIHKPDVAAVFTEPDTQKAFSVFQTEKDNETVTEISITDENGFTHLTEISEKDFGSVNFLEENGLNALAEYAKQSINKTASNETINYAPLNLRNHLYLHELDLKKPFISEAMKSLQKQISLIITMDGRNIYTAGIRQKHFLNVAPFAELQTVNGKQEWVEVQPKQGGGIVQKLMGAELYDPKTGEYKGRATPGIHVIEPVSSDTFIESANDKRARILAMADQLHVLMSDSATASGISRVEARDEFRKSLQDAKTPLDSLIRYIIEFAMMYAANLTGREAEFSAFRCDANCVVDAGKPTPEEIEVYAKQYEAGAISFETFQSYIGVEDTDAETAKIRSEPRFGLNLIKQFAEIAESLKTSIPLRLQAEILAENLGRDGWDAERILSELESANNAPPPVE